MKLPDSVLNTTVFFKDANTLEELLEMELCGEVMEGFDVVYDDYMVDYDDEDEEPDYSMVNLERLLVWSKNKVLIWDSGWRYFRVFPRNPEAKKPFRIKRSE